MGSPKPPDRGSFWTSTNGLIATITALVVAITTLIGAVVAQPRLAEWVGLSPTASPTPSSAGGSASAPRTKPEVGEKLLEDNFDNPIAGKLEPSTDDPTHYTRGYIEGEYVIKILVPVSEWPYTPVADLPDRYSDASIAVTARAVGDSAGQYITLACRSQGADSYYRLMVMPYNRTFVLMRWENGVMIELVPWQSSDAIRPDRASNRLELMCSGRTITVIINDRLVARKDDNVYSEGKMWIGAGLLEDSQGTAEVRFNDLIVTQR